jgi:hypothetical protein
MLSEDTMTRRRKSIFLFTTSALLIASVLVAAIFFRRHGAIPSDLFLAYDQLRVCTRCGLKFREKMVVILGVQSGGVTPVGRTDVHALLPQDFSCLHTFEMVAARDISIRTRDLKLERYSRGDPNKPTFYDMVLLRDALAPIAKTNASAAAEILAQLSNYRVKVPMPLDLQHALNGTNSTILSERLMKLARTQSPQ